MKDEKKITFCYKITNTTRESIQVRMIKDYSL